MERVGAPWGCCWLLLHLQGPWQESKWRPIHHMPKYGKVTNKTNSLNETCSILHYLKNMISSWQVRSMCKAMIFRCLKLAKDQTLSLILQTWVFCWWDGNVDIINKIKQTVHKLICILHNIYIPCLYENIILYCFNQDFLLICALLTVMIQRI